MVLVTAVVASTLSLCATEEEQEDGKYPLAAESLVKILLALVDLVLPLMREFRRSARASDVHLAGTVAKGVDISGHAVLVLSRFLLHGSAGASPKPTLVASLLHKGTLLRWFQCLAEMGSEQGPLIASEVVKLLQLAVSHSVPIGRGYVLSGGMDINAAQAAKVRPHW
jgi:hypothetical protein